MKLCSLITNIRSLDPLYNIHLAFLRIMKMTKILGIIMVILLWACNTSPKKKKKDHDDTNTPNYITEEKVDRNVPETYEKERKIGIVSIFL